MKLHIISFGFMRFSAPTMVPFVQNVVAATKSDPTYKALYELVLQVEALLETYRAKAHEAQTRASAAIEAKNEAFGLLRTAVHELARTVNFWAKGDGLYITNAGFKVQKTAHKTTSIGQVERLVAERGKAAGTVLLSWAKVEHAHLYEIREVVALNNGDPELLLMGSTTRCHFPIDGLKLGTKKSYCVCAIGANDLCGIESAIVTIWAS